MNVDFNFFLNFRLFFMEFPVFMHLSID